MMNVIVAVKNVLSPLTSHEEEARELFVKLQQYNEVRTLFEPLSHLIVMTSLLGRSSETVRFNTDDRLLLPRHLLL